MGKLVFILPNVEGGVRTYNNNLSKVLDTKLISHLIISYTSRDCILHQTKKTSTNFIQLFLSKYATTISSYKKFATLLNKDDTLICNDTFELEAIRFCKLQNKVIYILHGDLNHYYKAILNNQQCIDGVICVSEGLKEKYQQLFPNLKFSVSHPFVLNKTTHIKSTKDLPAAIFIGRFEYAKGADLFLQLLKKYFLPINWIVITTTLGSEKVFLDQIPSSVTIYKDISNEKVLSILSTTDVLVLPSRTEGFGIAILEALNKGVVPLVLDIPIGIPDQITNGFNGFIVKEEEWEKDACKYLENLLNDTNLLTEIKTNAIDFVLKKFDPNVIFNFFILQINTIEIRQKRTGIHRINFSEKVIPEAIFRLFKMINTKIKYGN